MTLPTFTIEDIRQRDPCYDPARYLPENWSGTALDILRHAEIPPQDKLWVVCHEGIIDDKTLRLFAVWCARRVQYLMTDPRSIAAIDVAESFARGEASRKELAAARVAARDAARAAAWDAAWDAAWGAAWDVARTAAWDVAWDVARVAAWDAAWDAAWGAAWDVARDAQVAQLIKMVEGL